MKIETNDIVGVYEENQLLCVDCFGNDWGSIQSEDILTRDTIQKDEGVLFFCDGCQRLIG